MAGPAHGAHPAWLRAVGCLLLVSLAACGDVPGRAAAPRSTPVHRQPLVGPGQVVVVRSDRTIAAVSSSGELAERLAALPPQAGEPDAVAVSPDGRLVLVSAVRSDDDEPSVCSATVLQVLPDGATRQLAQGAGIALSDDATRLAYFRYAQERGFCRRTELIVRELTDGSETAVTGADHTAGATPPEWPVNWSQDETAIAHVARTGAVVTRLDTGETTPLDRGAEGRPLSPAWLADGRLVALHGCCIGGASVQSVAPPGEVFAVPGPQAPQRSGRDGIGAWFTVEEQGLHHWDGRAVRAVYGDALLTSG